MYAAIGLVSNMPPAIVTLLNGLYDSNLHEMGLCKAAISSQDRIYELLWLNMRGVGMHFF